MFLMYLSPQSPSVLCLVLFVLMLIFPLCFLLGFIKVLFGLYSFIVCFISNSTLENTRRKVNNLWHFSFFLFFLFLSSWRNIPIVQLFLDQGDCSLKDHMRDFIELANLTTFLDYLLCIFYVVSLSEQLFVEWVLENNGLYFSICPSEKSHGLMVRELN